MKIHKKILEEGGINCRLSVLSIYNKSKGKLNYDTDWEANVKLSISESFENIYILKIKT